MDELKEEKRKRIRVAHHGADDMYHIFLDGEDIFRTKTLYEKSMFIAELTERLVVARSGDKEMNINRLKEVMSAL